MFNTPKRQKHNSAIVESHIQGLYNSINQTKRDLEEASSSVRSLSNRLKTLEEAVVLFENANVTDIK